MAVPQERTEEAALLYVDQDRCSGCGVCMTACPTRAITISGGKAAIDQELCDQCEACFDVCPQDAILTVFERSLAPDGSSERAVGTVAGPGMAAVPARMAPAVGAALLFVGREVVPRLARYVLDAVERRTGQPAEPAPPDGGRRRRRRRRGG